MVRSVGFLPVHRAMSAGVLGQDGGVAQKLVERAGQAVQPARLFQQVAPAQGPDDGLAHLTIDALAADQLQVLVGTVAFDADEHAVISGPARPPRAGQPQQIIGVSS